MNAEIHMAAGVESSTGKTAYRRLMCNFLFGGSMALKLNKAAYQKLIDEDIRAVRASDCEALEREHTVDVLRHSVECYYPEKRTDQLKAIEDWAKEKLERFGTSQQEEWTNSAVVLNALQMLPGLISKFLEDTAPAMEPTHYSDEALRPRMQCQI